MDETPNNKRKVSYNGKTYLFPPNASDEDIAEALKGMGPQQTAPAPKPTTLLDRLAGGAQTGTAAWQMTPMLPLPYRAGAAGLAGLLGGAYLPSEHPMGDTAASLAEFVGNKFIPGAGAASRMLRIARGGLIAGGSAAAGAVGNIGDRAADQVVETDRGPIGLYFGTTLAGLTASALFRPNVSELAQATQRVKGKTGVEIPLTFSEQTGEGAGLESLFVQGTRKGEKIAQAQNKAAFQAVDKILGAEKSEGKLLDIAINTQRAANTEYKVVETAVEVQNAPIKKQIADLAAEMKEATGADKKWYANEISKLQSQLQDPVKEFKAKFNLTDEEFNGFKYAAAMNPELLIDKLVPTGREPIKNLLAFRGLFDVLPEAEQGKLGTALVGRVLQRNISSTAEGDFLRGRTLLTALENYGEERLTTAIGPERVSALKDLAEVMEGTDPLNKLQRSGDPWYKTMVRYIANKQVFAISSGMAGAHLAEGMRGAAVAAGTGAVVAVPLNLMMASLLAEPKNAKLFIGMMKGDATAANRLVRALLISKKDEEPPPRLTPFQSFVLPMLTGFKP